MAVTKPCKFRSPKARRSSDLIVLLNPFETALGTTLAVVVFNLSDSFLDHDTDLRACGLQINDFNAGIRNGLGCPMNHRTTRTSRIINFLEEPETIGGVIPCELFRPLSVSWLLSASR